MSMESAVTSVALAADTIRIDDIPAFEKTVWLASPTMHGDEIRYMTEAYELNWMSNLYYFFNFRCRC